MWFSQRYKKTIFGKLMGTGRGLSFVIKCVIMTIRKTNERTIGGFADMLATMSKDELIKLWHQTDEKLKEINPMKDYESYEYYARLFDAIVKEYYKDSKGIIVLEDNNGDIVFNDNKK